jgi:hypothetical protein
VQVQSRQLSFEEWARNLGEHARSIAALSVRAYASAVRHIREGGEGGLHDGVARGAGESCNKPDPASVVLEA